MIHTNKGGRALTTYFAMALVVTAIVSVITINAKGATVSSTSRGGLYVLDTNNGAVNSQIILVDPSTGVVMRTYNTGYHPDMALSPDGTRLYVSSTRDNAINKPRNVLETFDTVSGTVLSSVDNPDSFLSTVPAYGTSMAMSPSGKYIYMMKLHTTKETTDEYVTAFDTQNERFLKDHVSLNTECNFVLLPTNDELTVDVACADSGGLREITFGDASEPREDRLWLIGAKERQAKWGALFLQPGGKNVAFISNSGSSFTVSRVSGAVEHLGTRVKSGPWIERGLMPESQTAVYFVIGRKSRPYPDELDTIVAVDPVTLAPRGTLAMTEPFFSMEISRDGSNLYTIDPERAAITVVDLTSFQEMRRLTSIGHTPTMAIAAP
jgi:DNA-binding beta-propeller fold protein YncE